jgi:hypothetical protein
MIRLKFGGKYLVEGKVKRANIAIFLIYIGRLLL